MTHRVFFIYSVNYFSERLFKDFIRIIPVGKNTLVGCSGDMSDFQFVKREIDKLLIKEYCENDKEEIKASTLNSYFSSLNYKKRNKGDFLLTSTVFGGIENGKKYLGVTDYLGTQYSDNFIVTGVWNYFALPLVRNRWYENMTESECRGLMEDCMRSHLYRIDRSINKVLFM